MKIDWEERRYEIAKAALQAQLAKFATFNAEFVVKIAISTADEMIKQLKKEN